MLAHCTHTVVTHKDQVIKNDDIVFFDFGPIFNGWSRWKNLCDWQRSVKTKIKKRCGRSLGRLTDDDREPNLPVQPVFTDVTELAKNYGWEFGGDIAGHIVGRYPHEQLDDPADLDWISIPTITAALTDFFLLDKHGNKRNWILEIQFVDRINNIGAFFEQLLTTD